MEAGLLEKSPLTSMVAGVSAGIVEDRLLLDLCYEEDSAAQVDLNCVMTDRGELVELQATGEARPFTPEEQRALTELCAQGIRQLLELQRGVIGGQET
ncbi:Ribonuclease PH [bioreactor metagenome]|uniref:Ribonuclease PH n=1 Tax=bioreactor metagenome TaxID=1076179 RepID=A0A645I6A0_9ZZZZ